MRLVLPCLIWLVMAGCGLTWDLAPPGQDGGIADAFTRPCPSGLTRCGPDCVDPASERRHCGGCDIRCRSGACMSGACACETGRTLCRDPEGWVCADLLINTSHCGGCEMPCGTGETCADGTCVPAMVCPPTQIDCGGMCVDLTVPERCGGCDNACGGSDSCCPTITSVDCSDTAADVDNCGSCGNACDLPNAVASCLSGRCEVSDCLPGFGDCDGLDGTGCETPLGTTTHCTSCGVGCDLSRGEDCATGTCECAAGLSACSGECVDVRTDPRHCGGCDAACPRGRICSGGACECPTGLVTCSGSSACVDVETDPANCGYCSRDCGTDQFCAGGTCTSCMGCPSRCCRRGEVCSGGMECTCGGGAGCSEAQTCLSGTCVDTCSVVGDSCSGSRTCCASRDGNVCVDLDADPVNCGACGRHCGAGQTCTRGTCTCSAGIATCGPVCCNAGEVCLDRTTGTCGCGTGPACASPQVCAGAVCKLPCSAGCGSGEGCCSEYCESLSTNVNCGICGRRCGSNSACSGTSCECLPGFGNCDGSSSNGCEADLLTSVFNCGACGRYCAGTCAGGVCSPVCTSPRVPCGTTCCPAGEVCFDPATGRCITAACVPTPCRRDADCNGGYAGTCEMGQCQCGGFGSPCAVGDYCIAFDMCGGDC